jgi:hypothetical protein
VRRLTPGRGILALDAATVAGRRRVFQGGSWEEEGSGLESYKESWEPGLIHLQFMRSGGITVGDKPYCKPT